MKPKKLGLALVALAVIGAVIAPAALADEFTAEKYPVALTGKIDPGTSDLFTTTVGNVSCNGPTYTATVTGATTTVSVTPNYSAGGCSAFGATATIDTNGCTFLFHVEGGTSTTGDMDLVCPAGQEFTATSGSPTTKCTVHIPSQSDIGGAVKYTTVGAGTTREITVEANLTGIDYTHTKGTGLGACTSGSGTTGALNNKALLTGETDGGSEHIGTFLSNV